MFRRRLAAWKAVEPQKKNPELPEAPVPLRQFSPDVLLLLLLLLLKFISASHLIPATLLSHGKALSLADVMVLLVTFWINEGNILWDLLMHCDLLII